MAKKQEWEIYDNLGVYIYAHKSVDTNSDSWDQRLAKLRKILEEFVYNLCESDVILEPVDENSYHIKAADLYSPLRRENWIPITEQLPADGQKCWTYQPVNDTWYRFEERVSVHQFHENFRDDWGGWWTGVEKDAGNFALWKTLHQDPDEGPTLLITHWMPYEVPEPPGGET